MLNTPFTISFPKEPSDPVRESRATKAIAPVIRPTIHSMTGILAEKLSDLKIGMHLTIISADMTIVDVETPFLSFSSFGLTSGSFGPSCLTDDLILSRLRIL